MLTIEQIREQIPHCITGTDFPNLGEKYEGKVRDNYTKGNRRILVTTDRLSAFDRIITLIPFKGQVLTQISQFWFEQTKDIAGNYTTEFPDPNVIVGRQCESIPVEMVVRGYLTGVTSTSAWRHYENGSRNFCGNVLPDGMKKDQKFPEPIITPSTKAQKGGHDVSLGRDDILALGQVSAEDFDKMADMAMKLYLRGREIAAKQGIILVDTKYEFGKDESGEIVLIDEIHTPDSSRFWYADEYEKRFAAGEPQKKIDKEYLREWLAAEGFVGEGEVPEVPPEIRAETARRYIEAYELITGQTFEATVDPNPVARIEKNLAQYS